MSNFEAVSLVLPRSSYLAIRVDGKNFTAFTKHMRKNTPFNETFNSRMLFTARHMLEEITGAVAAFVGSDEVSIIISPGNEVTEKWFGGRLDKMTSVSGSLATAAFNKNFDSMALFDARVIDLGSDVESACDYLLERQSSVRKNSISMLASHHFSHKTLMGVSTFARLGLLKDSGIMWDELSPHNKEGTLFFKVKREKTFTTRVRGEETEVTALRTVVEEIHSLTHDDLAAIL